MTDERPGPSLLLYEPSEDMPCYAHGVRISGWVDGADKGILTVHGHGGELARVVLRRHTASARMRISTTVDVSGWPQGEHRLDVVLTVGDLVRTATRRIVVDRARAFARVRGRPPAPHVPDDSVLVALHGAATAADARAEIEASLAAQSLRRFEVVAPGSLGAALDAFVDSPHGWLVVVEATGAFVPDALGVLVGAGEHHAGADAVYADDEWREPPPGAAPVHLKPAWSPELLLQTPYVGPVVAVGRLAAARLRGTDPADVRALLLGLDPATAHVVHVPQSLFVRSGHAAGDARPMQPPPPPPPEPCVSIVICTAYRNDLVLGALRSLATHEGSPIEVVLADDGSPRRTDALAICTAAGIPVRALTYPKPFNFSVANNLAARAAAGSELLFLNDDVEAPPTPWLEPMRAWLHRPGVGIVGAKLLYPDGSVQHAGVVATPQRIDNIAAGWPGDVPGPGGVLTTTRNTIAVTGACLLVHRWLFDALGGFEEALAIEFNDVDLPLRAAVLAGARTVWTPDATLVHHESATRGRDNSGPHDLAVFMARWRPLIAAGDPFGHPGLDPQREFEPTHEPPSARSRVPPWTRVTAGPLVVAEHERDAARAALDTRAVAERDSVRRVVAGFHATRSWRATRPLRAIANMIRTRWPEFLPPKRHKPMRIAWLVHQYLPDHIGGTEMYTHGLASRARADGHEVLVVGYTEHPGNDPAAWRVRTREFERVAVAEIDHNLSLAPVVTRAEYDNPVIGAQVRSILAAFRPDVVHCTHAMKLSAAAIDACHDLGVPVVVTLCDYWFLCPRHTLLTWDGRCCNGPADPAACFACVRDLHAVADMPAEREAVADRAAHLRKVLAGVHRVIALSKFQARMFVANGYDAERLVVIPHGVEASDLASVQPKPTGRPRLVFVGSIVRHKGLHVALAALRLRPALDVEFIVYGALRPGDPYCERIVTEAGADARVRLAGTFASPELGRVLSAADALVLPAQWYENDPLVVKAALHLGVPAIVSRLGSLEELVDDERWTVPPDDVDAWAAAIEAVLAVPDRPRTPRPQPTMDDHYRELAGIYRQLAAA